jgi:hypothetical protein
LAVGFPLNALEVVAMAKWIEAVLRWLLDKLFLAIGGFSIGGTIAKARPRPSIIVITKAHPPPSSDEIERVLREQIAQRRLVDAERERFFFEGDDYESNP